MIFVTTSLILQEVKTRALPGQYFADGSNVLDNVNVAVEKSIKKDYDVGTVFAVENLANIGLLYKADPMNILIPVCDKNEEFFDNTPDDVIDAYAEYRRQAMGFDPDAAPFPAAAKGKGKKATVKTPRKIPTLMEKLKGNPEYNPPTIEDDGFYIDAEKWYKLLRNTLRGKNTLLTGPTGTGKTNLIEIASRILNRNMHTFDMGSVADPQAALLGTHRIVNGESVFDYAKFVHAVQEPNTLILIDEITRSGPSVNNIFFPVLDHRRYVPIEIADSKHDRVIKIADSTVFVATANMGAEYQGTYQLDRALLGRMLVIEMPYLTVDQETAVLMKRTKIDKVAATKISKFAHDVRELALEEKLSTSVSHRETLEIGEAVRDGIDFVSAVKEYVIPLFEGTTNSGDKSTVLGILAKY